MKDDDPISPPGWEDRVVRFSGRLDRRRETRRVPIRSTVVLVVLAVLATARATRLVNEDAILDAPRAWIQRHAPDSVAYLVTCPWCVSIWLGGAVAAVAYNWPTAWSVQVGLLALAASYVTGVLAETLALMESKS